MAKKLLSKTQLEKLIEDNDLSLKFVEQKKTSKTSELWNFFHHVYVNNDQQQFVSCNTCKALLSYSSINGTNNLRTHFNSCINKDKAGVVCQKTVHDYYSSSKQSTIPKKIKLSVTRACTELCALDGRAFDVVRGEGFQGLIKVLLDAGQSLNKSQFDIKELIPHPTTVKIRIFFKICYDVQHYFFRLAGILLDFMMIIRFS
jgi:hypothetical protein